MWIIERSWWANYSDTYKVPRDLLCFEPLVNSRDGPSDNFNLMRRKFSPTPPSNNPFHTYNKKQPCPDFFMVSSTNIKINFETNFKTISKMYGKSISDIAKEIIPNNCRPNQGNKRGKQKTLWVVGNCKIKLLYCLSLSSSTF